MPKIHEVRKNNPSQGKLMCKKINLLPGFGKFISFVKLASENLLKFCAHSQYRSGHHGCYKKSVLIHFEIFSRKHLCLTLFLIKLQTFRPATLLKRDSKTVVFLWILRNFKNTYLEEHLRTASFISILIDKSFSTRNENNF